ncbi:MAG: aspartate kinase [Deltaproteobacteria bacterium]|nr:aspartate kinase [Deltaproteobacteria bacterium]
MKRRPLIVQKFGGTSVGTIERMQNVARLVAGEYRSGHDVVVVASAMAGETNRLIELAHLASPDPEPRELDCLLTTGEQVSVALLSMILNQMGIPARSILGFQMGMHTDTAHTKARIVALDRARFEASIDERIVLVAAGFQGIAPDGHLTTLGRGGSDTTAVAIAAELDADFCDIYTDVDGVYTADPNVCPDARRLERISYEEMLELASTGAKVLQIRSVELGMKYNVPLRVRSSFSGGPGTLVVKEEAAMEDVLVAGVACDKNEAKISLRAVADRPGMAALIFTPLAEANIVVDMIIQNVALDGTTDVTFTVPRTDLKQALAVMNRASSALGIQRIESDDRIAKISVVGVGMRSHAGVATTMFRALSDEGINIQMISTSEIKISGVIEAKDADRAQRALHAAFGLARAPSASTPRGTKPKTAVAKKGTVAKPKRGSTATKRKRAR